MSAKLTQRSLNCVEFVCSLELQEEHRALFFSSLCCGGAAGNVKVISNCESFFRWRSSSRLAPGVRNLIIAHEPGTVRLRGLSLPKPSPLLSSSLVFFFHLSQLICCFCSVFSLRGGDQQHEEWAGEVWHPDARLQQDRRDPGQWALCGRSCMWGGAQMSGGGGIW